MHHPVSPEGVYLEDILEAASPTAAALVLNEILSAKQLDMGGMLWSAVKSLQPKVNCPAIVAGV